MKNNINYKWLNILIICLIIYLLFLMKGIWYGIISKIFAILLPFIIAFGISYVLYPILKFLVSKKIPKGLAIFIIVFLIVLITGLTLYYALPLFFNQLINLLSNLAKVSNDVASKYNIDNKIINDTINKYSSKIIVWIGDIISSGSFIALLSKSIDYLSKVVIIFIVSIYFLIDMSKIRSKIKKYLMRHDRKKYHLISNIDKEVTSYLKGLGIFMIIQFFEYTILFFIIGHPNFLLLGILACITTVIPYFGGILTNVIALIIASVISSKVFILTLIITLIFPNIDGYIISPKIYGKTNELPPLLTIFVVFAGGALLGFYGIVISVPITIMIMAIIRSYKSEINNKIKKVKRKI